MTCFRPLPGDLISQLVTSLLESQRLKLFPSPSRGSYFSIWQKQTLERSQRKVSVPFPGILFLNEKKNYERNYELKGFRPLPGDLISQLNAKKIAGIKNTGFRPLPGDLISQSCPLHA